MRGGLRPGRAGAAGGLRQGGQCGRRRLRPAQGLGVAVVGTHREGGAVQRGDGPGTDGVAHGDVPGAGPGGYGFN